MKKTIFLLLSFTISVIQAQQTVLSSGGNATGSGGKISYSVGQLAYTTYTATSGSVAQGVQQAFEFVTLGVENNLINLSVVAFPNPTTNILNLTVKDYNPNNMYYQLFDIQGRLLIQHKLTHLTTAIQTQNLTSAVYFLKIFNNSSVVKTFKIIKN